MSFSRLRLPLLNKKHQTLEFARFSLENNISEYGNTQFFDREIQ